MKKTKHTAKDYKKMKNQGFFADVKRERHTIRSTNSTVIKQLLWLNIIIQFFIFWIS